ncbi:MAG: DinB family protein [Caldilineaceae bacterium]|nr:DinB family protein [Caldilineaceae bacterium]
MNVQQLFLQRYTVLYDFWLAGFWEAVPHDLMRQRPHPRVNSIAWNLWHLTRVEDAAMNRFIVDLPQVLDEGQWMSRMNVPWRHGGSEMTFAEVDELNQRIDLQALHDYARAVHLRTCEIIAQLNMDSLDETMKEDRLRVILFDEGLAGPRAVGLLENYIGWSRGKVLMNLALTHPYQHVGEMGVIASLLGVEME